MIRRLLPLLLLFAAVPATAYGMTATDIVRRAYDADLHVSYRGVKAILVRTNETKTQATIKVVHLAPDKMRKEYFAPASLAGIVVIQNGRRLWKCDPLDPTWEAASSDRYGPGRCCNCQTALANYDVKLLGSARVAGRDTYVIRATHKNGKEPSRTIWVDKGCYLILKTRAESPEGVVRSSSGFTSIAINPRDISPEVFVVAGNVQSSGTPAGLDFSVQKPSYLPKGYHMIGITKGDRERSSLRASAVLQRSQHHLALRAQVRADRQDPSRAQEAQHGCDLGQGWCAVYADR